MSKPQRIQLSRRRGFLLPPNAVNVARPSRWGNLFGIKDLRRGFPDLDDDSLRDMSVRRYSVWLGPYGEATCYDHVNSRVNVELLERRQWILDHIHELRGKNLACWCKPGESCHADVLIELAND